MKLLQRTLRVTGVRATSPAWQPWHVFDAERWKNRHENSLPGDLYPSPPTALRWILPETGRACADKSIAAHISLLTPCGCFPYSVLAVPPLLSPSILRRSLLLSLLLLQGQLLQGLISIPSPMPLNHAARVSIGSAFVTRLASRKLRATVARGWRSR